MVDIGKVSLAKYFAAAIIASTKRKANIVINFMLQHASSQYQRPKLKNPRHPVNPDSKRQPTPNVKKSSTSNNP